MTTPAESTPTQPTILVVDDTPTNVRVLLDYLREQNFKVLVATSGNRALQQLERVQPDLILLDVVMPGIDGFETCRQLKANPLTKEIPVIFMTALSDTVDKVKGFEVGAVDYVTKPFQQEEVLARIEAHLTIQQQKNELRELNATKDKLFSIIGHDLRNHFAGMIGLVDFMVDDSIQVDPEFMEGSLDSIHALIHSSYKLLENLLTWASLQRGVLRAKPSDFDLEPVVQMNTFINQETAVLKKITVSHQVAPSTFFVRADENMVNTVIRNLISNAIKFTHEGGSITVTAEAKDGQIVCAVTDTGVGMSEKRLNGLFQIGGTTSTDGTAGEPGTGLGLILCHDFVQQNGGHIWAESIQNKGTTFRFTLPVAE
ncbi:MAG: hybrid sensor histidine kinase/response regulator [Chloroflexota bacterium]